MGGSGGNGQVVITYYYLAVYNITPEEGSFCQGDTVAIGLSGSETGVSYQLLLDSNPVGSPVAGTGNAISFGNHSALGVYTVVANLVTGGCTLEMNGSVVIHALPVCAVTGPAGPVCPGSANEFLAQEGMLHYAWTVTGNGAITGPDTSISVTVTAGFNCDSAFSLYLVVTDSNDCSSGCSKVVMVEDTVSPEVSCPESLTATGPSACTGTLSLDPPAYSDDCAVLSLTWSMSGATVASSPSGGINLVGTYTFNPGVTMIEYIVKDHCGNSDSCTFSVTIPPPLAVMAGSNSPVCEDSTLYLTSSFSGGTPGYFFSWTGPDSFISDEMNPSIPGVTLAAAGDYILTVTDTNGCQATATVHVVVHPTPVVSASPVHQDVCHDSPTAPVIFSSTVEPASYGWTNDTPSIGLAASGSGNIPSFTAINPGTDPVTATITVIPEANDCPGLPLEVTITVKPLPVGTASDQTICSGETTAVALYSSLPSTTFTWTAALVTSPPSGTVTGFGPCGSSCGNLISQTLVNTTMTYPDLPLVGGPGVVRYTITPYADGCVGLPFEADVTVNPVPGFFEDHIISWNSNFPQDDMEICTGGSILNDNDIDIIPPPPSDYFEVPGWSVQWEYSNTPTGPWLPAPGYMSANYQWVLSSAIFTELGTYYFRFTVTNTYGCPSSSNIILLRVISTLVVEAGGPDFLCISDSPVPHTLEGAFVGGASSTSKTGKWSITSLTPPNGPNVGVLSDTVHLSNPAVVTYTPPAGYAGTVVLTLTSNKPGGDCLSITDTRTITILPGGTFEGCFLPEHWELVNNPEIADGYYDDTSAPCQVTLLGSDSPALAGDPAGTDLLTCAEAGTFSFDWYFAAPANRPVWHAEDQQLGTATWTSPFTRLRVNRPTNLSPGDLIVIVIHLSPDYHLSYQYNFYSFPPGFTEILYTQNNVGTYRRARIYSCYKIASGAEPAYYDFLIERDITVTSPRIISARVTGHDPADPVGNRSESIILYPINPPSNYTGYWEIHVPSVGTSYPNSLLVAALSVAGSPSFANSPVEMTTFYNHNTRTAARVAVEEVAAPGMTGDRTFFWPRYNCPSGVNCNSLRSAAQMFVINPPAVPETDAAYYIVDGSPVFLSQTGGESGSVSLPVDAGTGIGFRVSTASNTGGRGRLTIYNMSLEDPVPAFTACPADTVYLGCNANPTAQTALQAAGPVTDVCYDSIGIQIDSAYYLQGCLSTKTFTINAVNGCGNDTTCRVIYRWTSDLEPPVVTCPGPSPFTVVVNNVLTYVHSGPAWDATASDNCSAQEDVSLLATLSGATVLSGAPTLDGVAFNIGTTWVNWIATDECGNSDSCAFEVIVLGTVDLEVQKTGVPDPVIPGNELVYTLLIINHGPADAPELTLTDSIPAEVLSPEYSLDSGITWTPWTGSWFSAAALAAGDSLAVLIRGEVDCIVSDFENTAEVQPGVLTDPEQGNNFSTWLTTIDDPPPTFIAPDSLAFCVYRIEYAWYNGLPEPDADIEPERPDWYIIDGTTELDLTGIDDNCCEEDEMTIHWTITFNDIPPHPPVSGTGQPSTHGPITLWGTNDHTVVVHQITYDLVDCNGNASGPVTVDITMKPRPNVIKLY